MPLMSVCYVSRVNPGELPGNLGLVVGVRKVCDEGMWSDIERGKAKTKGPVVLATVRIRLTAEERNKARDGCIYVDSVEEPTRVVLRNHDANEREHNAPILRENAIPWREVSRVG